MITLPNFERLLLRGDAFALRQSGLPNAAAAVSGHLDRFLPPLHSSSSSSSDDDALSVTIAHQCALSSMHHVTVQAPALTAALSTGTLPLMCAYTAGVALLQVFLRDNWAGPPSPSQSASAADNDAAELYLRADGEDVAHGARSLYCLRAARFLLFESLGSLRRAGASLAPWWAARVLMAHQAVLSNPVPSLQRDLFKAFAGFLGPSVNRTTDFFDASFQQQHQDSDDDDDLLPMPVSEHSGVIEDEEDSYVTSLSEHNGDRYLLVLAYLELAAAQRTFYDSDAAVDSLRTASEIARVAVRMSGEMGVRTKYQKVQKAQLIARAFTVHPSVQVSPARAEEEEKKEKEEEGRLAIDFPCVPKENVNPVENGASEGHSGGDEVSDTLPLPEDVAVNDTDVLGYIKLSDSAPKLRTTPKEENDEEEDDDGVFQLIDDSRLGEQVSELTPLEQALVLAHASIVRAKGASHILTNEEMASFVELVIRNSKTASHCSSIVQLKALLYRVSFERDRGRYLERSMAQMEVLAKFVEDPLPEHSASARARATAERTYMVTACAMPPQWELMKELAVSFGKMGLVKSAMGIFEKYEFWEELVDCHRLVGNLGKAEQMVREQLDILDTAVVASDGTGIGSEDDDLLLQKDVGQQQGHHHTHDAAIRAVQERAARRPRLLCVLGEVTRDESHFRTAWDESNGRYARAKRALARMCIEREQWADAIVHFHDALRVNPLFPDAWFSYGCAALKVGDIQLASHAFTTVVQQVPSNAEGWNNLARTLHDLGKKRESLAALTEAAKLHRDSWRIWMNIVTIAMELPSALDIVRGMERLLELRGKEGIMTEALGVAVTEVERISINLNNNDDNDNEKKTARTKVDRFNTDTVNVRHICKRLLSVLQKCTTLDSTNASVWAACAQLHEMWDHVSNSVQAFECRLKQVRALVAHGEFKTELKAFRHMVLACHYMMRDAVDTRQDENKRSAKLMIDSILEQTGDSFKEDQGFSQLKQTCNEVNI